MTVSQPKRYLHIFKIQFILQFIVITGGISRARVHRGILNSLSMYLAHVQLFIPGSGLCYLLCCREIRNLPIGQTERDLLGRRMMGRQSERIPPPVKE